MTQERLAPQFDKDYEHKVGRCKRCDFYAVKEDWKLDEDKKVWKIPRGWYCISCLQYFVWGYSLQAGLIP